MKKSPIITLIILLVINVSAFSQSLKGTNLQLSGEKCFITTNGDAEGYSVLFGVNRFYSKIINVGVNLRFASALSNPYLFKSFYHKSVIYLEPQVNWYPLNNVKGAWKFLHGLGVSTGVSVFYGQFSTEGWSDFSMDLTTGEQLDRLSRIKTNDETDIGYLINVFYQLPLTKKLLLGARIDFANYSNNDGYSAYGVSVSYKIN